MDKVTKDKEETRGEVVGIKLEMAVNGLAEVFDGEMVEECVNEVVEAIVREVEEEAFGRPRETTAPMGAAAATAAVAADGVMPDAGNGKGATRATQAAAAGAAKKKEKEETGRRGGATAALHPKPPRLPASLPLLQPQHLLL